MKIAVISGRFGLSGVPLAQQRLAKAFSKRGHQVDLIYGAINSDSNLPNSNDMRIICLNKTRVIGMLAKLTIYMIKEKPNVIFSAGDHLNVVVLVAKILSFQSIKVSCSSRVTPYDTYKGKIFSKNWILKQISKILMNKADVLSCVSKEMVGQYQKLFKNSKHMHIYNPINLDEISVNAKEKNFHPEFCKHPDQKIIVAAGMLERWKGFHDLIDAFKIASRNSDLKLYILGEGSQRNFLLNQIKKQNLSKKVFLLGAVTNPIKYFSSCDLFVLSSYVEGMPNVLIEALACGCTVVSYDCETGPKEVLNKNNGYLCKTGDVIELAEKIKYGIENPISKDLARTSIESFYEENVVMKHLKSLNIQI